MKRYKESLPLKDHDQYCLSFDHGCTQGDHNAIQTNSIAYLQVLACL